MFVCLIFFSNLLFIVWFGLVSCVNFFFVVFIIFLFVLMVFSILIIWCNIVLFFVWNIVGLCGFLRVIWYKCCLLSFIFFWLFVLFIYSILSKKLWINFVLFKLILYGLNGFKLNRWNLVYCMFFFSNLCVFFVLCKCILE